MTRENTGCELPVWAGLPEYLFFLGGDGGGAGRLPNDVGLGSFCALIVLSPLPLLHWSLDRD